MILSVKAVPIPLLSNLKPSESNLFLLTTVPKGQMAKIITTNVLFPPSRKK